MSEKYDVIIIGAGPAGIFTALELVKKDHLKILIIEKGQDLKYRASLTNGRRRPKDKFAILSGWGGAGAFSDGKLTLSTEVGGWLTEYITDEELQALIEYADQTYKDFGAPEQEHGTDESKVAKISSQAEKAGLSLIPSKIRHLGTDNEYKILGEMKKHLNDKIDILFETEVDEILVSKEKVVGVKTADGKTFESEYVVAAPGRAAASWLVKEAERLKLGSSANAVDIGVRVEVPATILEPLTGVLYEPKLIYKTKEFGDRIRTFCMNPYGEVSLEVSPDLVTVNGHSYANRRTENTNFALLVSTKFTEPFKEPIAYGKYIARLANLLGDGIIIQRLADLKDGQRSTKERIKSSTLKPTLDKATPGDLSFVLPYRYIANILEMLEVLDKMAPGINARNTLLYGVEVKFYSARINLSKRLETKVKNLYAIGDGAGITRGLIQSSCCGILTATDILRKRGKI
ncbi:MAG TPA: FAD-dependent oxidoreductase [Actinobacteria bacterium]|nr:FAD-dependent oxidoreductase [Actinomycetota bacterium]